jgi:mannose-6-phosphate isomerase-like protein (cupin superfamily)
MTIASAILLAALLVPTPLSLAAQQSAPAATYVPAADLAAVLKRSTEGGRPSSDASVKNVPGKLNNVAVNIGHRTQAGASMAGGSHANMTEIWYITEGTGTVTTGGTFVSPTQAANGDVRGTIQNGVSQRVTVGDVIVIPPGTPHTFSELETPLLVFLNIRITPGQ